VFFSIPAEIHHTINSDRIDKIGHRFKRAVPKKRLYEVHKVRDQYGRLRFDGIAKAGYKPQGEIDKKGKNAKAENKINFSSS
jgi:hypothetical protein